MNQQSVCRQSVTVKSKTGLHLRPISQIVELVRDSGCRVSISKGEMTVSADNVLDLMTLNAAFGTILDIEVNGGTAATVLEDIVRLFESSFEEEGSSAS